MRLMPVIQHIRFFTVLHFWQVVVALLTLFCTPYLMAEDQSVLMAGLIQYGSTQSRSLLNNTGYFVQFQSEHRSKDFRPTFGITVEEASGTFNNLQSVKFYHGSVSGGLDLFIFRTAYIQPFFGAQATVGWGYMNLAGSSTLGVSYGALMSGGTQIRWNQKPQSKCLRVSTQFRVMRTNIGGITSFQLDGFILGFGIVF